MKVLSVSIAAYKKEYALTINFDIGFQRCRKFGGKKY